MRAWPPKVTKGPPVPTAYLDRDGTINRDKAGSYVLKLSQLRIYAKAPAAVKLLNAKGYRVVVLTNQSAVGRGYMTMAASRAINLKMVRELRRAGAVVDAVYFCPHAPEAGCACRKPKPGLIKEAAKDRRADLARSFMAGDKKCDLDLARNAGIAGRLVLTGQWRASLGPAAAKKGLKDLLTLARALPDVSGGPKRKLR
ncbi:MAG: HAD family hydrolase [Elusimicrobiales bacterium]|nr:HAD family hydrolase [Elusimicrobiales bacterium]